MQQGFQIVTVFRATARIGSKQGRARGMPFGGGDNANRRRRKRQSPSSIDVRRFKALRDTPQWRLPWLARGCADGRRNRASGGGR